MFYEVSKEVFDKLPNFVVGVVAVTGINNAKEYPAIEKMLEENSNEVIQYFAEVFELDFIGHAQLLENHPHQIHTVAGGLAVFQEGVGPYVPGVFIDHRVVSSEVEGIFCLVLRITLRQSTQQNNQQGDKTLLPYATVAPPLGIMQWIDHLRLF